MDWTALAAYSDEKLGNACFAPLIEAYKEAQRRGESFEALFGNWSKGKQALFVFLTFDKHAVVDDAEYYWRTAYSMAQPPRWNGLLKALRFFGDEETASVLVETERVLDARQYPRSLERFEVSLQDLERDADLHAEIRPLYLRYCSASRTVIKKSADYIRLHPEEFIPSTS
ncbi:hypothetical protein [Paenibacillus sp. NPDC058071]|uniref:hypothetical protein n=1 Tax=Paenibacillus sp. NPDC058071 TaxID=3346326 RepID=UPI0036D9C860